MYRKYLLFFFGLLAIIAIACSDGDIHTDPEPDTIQANDLSIVTGINFYDISGAPIGKVGNPNTTSNENLAVYPIPANSTIAVQNMSTSSPINIFIIPVQKDTSFSDVSFKDSDFDYEDKILDSLEVVKFEGVVAPSIVADLSSLENGYYRLIAKQLGNTICVENIYLDKLEDVNSMIVYLQGEF